MYDDARLFPDFVPLLKDIVTHSKEDKEHAISTNREDDVKVPIKVTEVVHKRDIGNKDKVRIACIEPTVIPPMRCIVTDKSIREIDLVNKKDVR